MTHNARDIDADLRPLEDYAIASVIGCAIMAVTFCAIGCALFLIAKWLAG